MIERGEADAVVAGGTEAALTGLCMAAFKRMGAMSREGISRPFDAKRDGFVIGEGAGVLVLEREEHAQARGAKVSRRSPATAPPTTPSTSPCPTRTARARCAAMREALADAGASADDVGYINAHGTSTPFNDKIETSRSRASSNGASSPAVSARQGAIGHLLGAAGAVEARVYRGDRRGVLPPTMNYG